MHSAVRFFGRWGEGPSQSRMARPAVQRQFTHRNFSKAQKDGFRGSKTEGLVTKDRSFSEITGN